MANIFNRLGKFVFERHFIENNPEAVMLVMGKCVVVRAEAMAYNDTIEYVAYSPAFDRRELGQTIQSYSWNISDSSAIPIREK